jgi:DNA-binding beta-propeller fold protein YncE
MARRSSNWIWGAAVAVALVVPHEGSIDAFPLNNGMEASKRVAQETWSAGFEDFATHDFFGARATAANSFFVAADVSYDEDGQRLFVADEHNYRVLVFDVSQGYGSMDAATLVLGQPDYETGGADISNPYGNKNTACGGGSSGAVNECGLGRVWGVEYDGSHDRVFVADFDNHRVLVWDLGGAVTEGMAADAALGQQDLSTGALNSGCVVGEAGTVNACGLRDPTDMAYDAAGQRLFVVDSSNHRVLVYQLPGGAVTTGMAATGVIGQPDLVTATANTACGGGSAGAVSGCGLFLPNGVSYDAAQQRLFVTDDGNRRVLVFDVSSAGDLAGLEATGVLGQPDLVSGGANTDCPGGGAINACNLGEWGLRAHYDPGSGVLFVADAANHRVLAFDAATVTDGEAAFGVLGQDTFSAGLDLNHVAFGGGTSRTEVVLPLGLAIDVDRDQLFVADGGNHRVITFGANVGGTAVQVEGAVGSSTTTEEEDGSTTVEIIDTHDDGQYFSVTFPEGTTSSGEDEDITVTIENPPPGNNPFIVIENAVLPPGTTKSVSMPAGGGSRVCIRDRSDAASFGTRNNCGPGSDAVLKPANGACETYTVRGDPGDNDHPQGLHDVTVCLEGGTLTLEGLLHSAAWVPACRPGNGNGNGNGNGKAQSWFDPVWPPCDGPPAGPPAHAPAHRRAR